MLHLVAAIVTGLAWRYAGKPEFRELAKTPRGRVLYTMLPWWIKLATFLIGVSCLLSLYIICRQDGDGIILSICKAEYVAIQTFTTIGYGDAAEFKKTPLDFLVFSGAMLLASFGWALIVGFILAFLQAAMIADGSMQIGECALGVCAAREEGGRQDNAKVTTGKEALDASSSSASTNSEVLD